MGDWPREPYRGLPWAGWVSSERPQCTTRGQPWKGCAQIPPLNSAEDNRTDGGRSCGISMKSCPAPSFF
jgi:hypothetical protein